MHLQATSIVDAAVLLGAGLGAAVMLGVRRMRRVPLVPAMVPPQREG